LVSHLFFCTGADLYTLRLQGDGNIVRRDPSVHSQEVGGGRKRGMMEATKRTMMRGE
jgi:hypothetical protein